MDERSMRGVGLAVVLGIGYWALSRLGLEFTVAPIGVAVAWPASALALAVVALSPRRLWPGLAGAIFVGNLVAQTRPGTISALLAGINALEPLIAVTVLQRLRRRGPDGTRPVEDVFALIVGAVVGSGVAATLAATVLNVGSSAPWTSVWTTWWVADGLGMLTLTPLALALRGTLRTPRPDRLTLAVATAALAYVALLFLQDFGGAVNVLQYPYTAFPLLLWVALRADARVTSAVVAGTTALSTLAIVHELGPFARPDLSTTDRVEVTQGFLAIVTVMVLLVDAVVRERRAAEQHATATAAHLDGILDAATETSIIATDLDGQITSFNPGAERLLGYVADDVVGHHSPALFHDETEVAARAAELGIAPGFGVFVATVADGGHEQRDWTYVAADGRRRSVSLVVTAIRDDRGAPSGYIGVGRDVTDQRRAERDLRASEERLQLLVASLPDAIVGLYDEQLRVLALNGAILARQGLDPAAMVGRELAEVTPVERQAQILPLFAAALQGRTSTVEYLSPRNGRIFDFDVLPVELSAGRRGVLSVMRDVTDRREQERAVRDAEQDLRTIFASASIGQVVVDARGRVERSNPAFTLLAGPAAEVPATPVAALIHPGDRPALEEALGTVAKSGAAGVELDLRLLEGDAARGPVQASLHLAALTGGRVLVQVVDLTERKRFEQQLRHMADHDPLTGLLNRRSFERELDRHVDHVRRYGAAGAVLMLDIDHFKRVNDTLGHHAGDELIIGVGRTLAAAIRASDTVARLGGDEFAVLLPQADAAEAENVAAKLVQAIRDDVTLLNGTSTRQVTTSVGLAMVTERDDLSGDALMMDADLALYDAKDAGRDGFAAYADAEHQVPRTRAQLAWIDRISDALAHDRLVLHAQPIEHLATGAITQHELLLRMVDDDGELIAPGVFLYVAERYGLAPRVDRWVSRRAIELVAAEQRAGREVLIEVNVSGHSLADTTFMRTLEDDIRGSGIDPRALIFEITETAAVADVAVARAFAERLRDLGCRFALDDFGAGFGSFYYLKHLPSDYLKIDGEFIRRVVSSEDDQAIVSALVHVARGLGKQTIAEWVADEATRAAVRAMGVDYAQGFAVGHPVPLEDVFASARAAPVRVPLSPPG